MTPSQKQSYPDREKANPTAAKETWHAVYNPSLFTQLELYRSDLDREYFALLEALENDKPLKVRHIFIQFNETLLRYLNKNRIELYGYLEKLHKNDEEKFIIVKANKIALNTAIDVITRTLVSYISPSAAYNKKFEQELHAIWTILKWRYKREKQLLYPLYKNKRPKWHQASSA